MWMLIGLVVLALGFFPMSGGKKQRSESVQRQRSVQHHPDHHRPILIIAGFVIEIFAIMKKSKTN